MNPEVKLHEAASSVISAKEVVQHSGTTNPDQNLINPFPILYSNAIFSSIKSSSIITPSSCGIVCSNAEMSLNISFLRNNGSSQAPVYAPSYHASSLAELDCVGDVYSTFGITVPELCTPWPINRNFQPRFNVSECSN